MSDDRTEIERLLEKSAIVMDEMQTALAKAKPKGKRKSKRTSKERTSPLPIPDRRAMERSLADLHKHLDEQVFESEEEVNAYLQQLLGPVEPTHRPEPSTGTARHDYSVAHRILQSYWRPVCRPA